MNKRRKPKRRASKKVHKSRGIPEAPWILRLTPELRNSAKLFHETFVKRRVSEEGSPDPPITTLTVRLKFASPLQGSRAAELIQMIGAASEQNIAADALRASRMSFRLKSLEAQAVTKRNVEIEVPEKLKWTALLKHIQEAIRATDELGEPPYQSPENTSADSFPDFKSIWRERERYTAQLPELERVDRVLKAEFERLNEGKPALPRYTGTLRPLEIESAGREVEISACDLLGGPLALWASQLGNSASHTECLSKDPRWRELALAYCELHLKSGLLDYEPGSVEGGRANPCWVTAREVLSQAQRHLLDFLKAACEIDNPPAVAEEVFKAKEAEVGTREVEKPTTGKAAGIIVSVKRVGKCGGDMEVRVNEALLGGRTTTSKKVLLAGCVLHFGPAQDGWWKTSHLMKLVLNKTEHGALGERSATLLNRWKGALRVAAGVDLETDDAGRSFRLPGVEFDTRLSRRVIEAALSRFSEKYPIEIRGARIDRP